MNETVPEHTSEERMLAGLSHLLGFWVALIVWLVEKDKSRYVNFQALQSMAYSAVIWALGLVVSLGFGLLVMSLIALAALFALGTGQQDPAPMMALPVLLPMTVFCVFLPFGLLVWVPRLVAAFQTLQGREFRYPWLGAQVEKFLKPE